MRYAVYLNVAYKPSIKDPEGETISKDLLARLGHDVAVRSGKCLVLYIDAPSPEDAEKTALYIAREARLGNPHVHVIQVVRIEEA